MDTIINKKELKADLLKHWKKPEPTTPKSEPIPEAADHYEVITGPRKEPFGYNKFDNGEYEGVLLRTLSGPERKKFQDKIMTDFKTTFGI